ESIGSTIRLVVAAPEGPVAVPNVTGQSLSDAQKALEEAGFGHTPTREHSDSVEEGRVIRTEPAANEKIERGTTVTIVVSSGPEPTQEPTETPTADPSESPTESPSERPSESHPAAPSESPTDHAIVGESERVALRVALRVAQRRPRGRRGRFGRRCRQRRRERR